MCSALVTRRVFLCLGGLTILNACHGRPHGAQAHTRSGTGIAVPPAAGAHPRRSFPRVAQQQPEFYLPQGPQAVALTIDDGPDPVWTPPVLDLLRRLHIIATFSQVGSAVESHPDVVRAVTAEGHVIANHTWSHRSLTRMPDAQVRYELERTSEAIGRASGRPPALFRAPFGAWSEAAIACCRDLGMRPLDWSVDPHDWARPGIQHIVHTILQNTRPGSIILEHDGGGDRSQTLEALRIALPALRNAGYRFVTP